MLEITHVGHQGWAFRTAESCVLVDALLTPSMGHGVEEGRVWPPRVIDLARMPTIDAYVCSHEHADHYDVPSLDRLDRAIPIVLPARSSLAAVKALEEQGFAVHRAMPDDVLTVGDIEVSFFSPDHVADDNHDEWDVLPFLVRDRRGDGRFGCQVDVALPERTKRRLYEAAGGMLEVWGVTINSMRWDFQIAGRPAGADLPILDALALVAEVSEWCRGARHAGRMPRALAFSGGGMSFDGDVTWLNRNCFPLDLDRVVAALRPLVPECTLMNGVPGETLRLERGEVVGLEPRTPWLSAAPRDAWPNRALVGDVSLQTAVAPFTTRAPLDDAGLAELDEALRVLAEHLYGGTVFRQIYSATGRTLAGRKPTVALVLRDGDGAYVYEYEPQACRFVPVESDDPARDYASGLELWASDLLAVARGEMEISTIVMGRVRGWNARPDVLAISPRSLSLAFTPLRRPEAQLRLYRRAFSPLSHEPRVRAGGAPVSLGPRT